jgi:hypothetical protein
MLLAGEASEENVVIYVRELYIFYEHVFIGQHFVLILSNMRKSIAKE